MCGCQPCSQSRHAACFSCPCRPCTFGMGIRRATRRRVMGGLAFRVVQIRVATQELFPHARMLDQRQPGSTGISRRPKANGSVLSSSGISTSGNRSTAVDFIVWFLFATVGAGGRPLIHFGPSPSSLIVCTSQYSLTSAQFPVGRIY